MAELRGAAQACQIAAEVAARDAYAVRLGAFYDVRAEVRATELEALFVGGGATTVPSR